MSNEITIIVKAKNMLAAGLKAATSDMHVLGKTADKVAGQMINGFKMVAGAVIAAGAAILSAGTVAVKAYAESEAAERNLASAIAGHGGAVDALLPKYKALADEISRKTGMDDEQILGLETLLTNMGVTTAEMEKATKGAIGLSKALGMDQTAAAKAAALALDGNYTALAKYIPALKTATTDSEKAAIVQQAMASGYAAEEAALTTLGGRYRELTTTTGNFLESIGQVISENAMVQDGMALVSEKIRNAQAAFEDYAATGKLNALVMEIELFASHAYTNFANVAAYAAATGTLIADGFMAPFRYIGGIIGATVNYLVAFGEAASAVAKAVADKFKNPFTMEYQAPSSAELQSATDQFWQSFATNPTKGKGLDVFADAEASAASNNAADAKRTAEIMAQFDKAEQERLAKDLAKTETTLGAATAGDIADVEEEATAANIETATASKVDKVETVAAVEAAADTARIDTNTAREIESVGLIAKAREEAYAQTDPYDAAKAFAGAGQAITPESIAKNGLIATEQAAQAEADRIQAIVEALNEANGGPELLKYAEETAANTRAIAELLPQAIALGD